MYETLFKVCSIINVIFNGVSYSVEVQYPQALFQQSPRTSDQLRFFCAGSDLVGRSSATPPGWGSTWIWGKVWESTARSCILFTISTLLLIPAEYVNIFTYFTTNPFGKSRFQPARGVHVVPKKIKKVTTYCFGLLMLIPPLRARLRIRSLYLSAKLNTLATIWTQKEKISWTSISWLLVLGSQLAPAWTAFLPSRNW